MRGSPLLKSILILLGLVVSGFGLVHLTGAAVEKPAVAQPIPTAATQTLVPYHLVLSAEASAIQISSGDLLPLHQISGTLPIPANSPTISLKISWKNPPLPGEQRFAKLTLDPPGKPTLTHVFDSSGDIDDILELP